MSVSCLVGELSCSHADGLCVRHWLSAGQEAEIIGILMHIFKLNLCQIYVLLKLVKTNHLSVIYL